MIILRERDSDPIAVSKGVDRVAASQELRSILWAISEEQGPDMPAGVDWLYRESKMPLRIFVSSLATLFGSGWVEATGLSSKESIRFTRNGSKAILGREGGPMPNPPIPARQRQVKVAATLDSALGRLSDEGELTGWQRVEDAFELAARLVRAARLRGRSRFGFGLDMLYRQTKIPLGTFIGATDQLLSWNPPYLYVESEHSDSGLGVKIGRERIVLMPHTVDLMAKSRTNVENQTEIQTLIRSRSSSSGESLR